MEFAFYAMFAIEAWYTDLKAKDSIAKETARLNEGIAKAKICAERGWNTKKYDDWKRKQAKEAKEAKKLAKEEAKKRKAEEKALAREEQKKKKKKKKAMVLADDTTAPPFPSLLTSVLLPPPIAAPQSAQHRPTVAMQFITRTAAAGISFNAWFLFAFLHVLAQSEHLRAAIPFATRLLTEQAAEKIFRAVRAVLGGENFTLADFFRRCDRFMAYNILRALHDGVDFVFPEHDSAWKWDESVASDKEVHSLPASATTAAAIGAITSAKLSCIADLLAVDIDVHKFESILHLDVDVNLEELEPDEDEDVVKRCTEVSVAPAVELQSDLLRVAENAAAVVRQSMQLLFANNLRHRPHHSFRLTRVRFKKIRLLHRYAFDCTAGCSF